MLSADGNVVWQKDLGSDAYCDIQTNPSDARHLILNTKDGVFSSLFLNSFHADQATFKRFEAEISPGGSLHCWMPGAHDMVVLLLQREVCIGCTDVCCRDMSLIII